MVEATETIQTHYTSIDNYSEIAQARLQGRREAYEIKELNRQTLLDGDFDQIPIDIDALGTARRVAESEFIYGKYSPERQQRFGGLVLDCKRLYAEAARVNTYEYFPKLIITFEEETEEYYSHGESVMKMTEGGLSPVAKPEEGDRRINERVEEVTYKTIRQLGKLSIDESVVVEPVKLRTISECADWAIEAYEADQKRTPNRPRSGYGGYAPQIKKFMVRDVDIDPNDKDRTEEQIGLSGEYITHDVITEALSRGGLTKGVATKTELQGNQLEVDDDLIDFVALLDSVASEHSGHEIYMGEVLPEGAERDYEHIREQAIERQNSLDDKAFELAEFVMALEAADTDRWAATGLVEAEVKRVLLGMAYQNNSIAVDMFDKATEQGLREVAYLQSIGQMTQAEAMYAEVAAKAPSPGYCGAGSCGLEAINPGSKEAKLMEKMGLKSSDALKDKERSCRECSKKSVVYDLKTKQKGCTSCSATAKY